MNEQSQYSGILRAIAIAILAFGGMFLLADPVFAFKVLFWGSIVFVLIGLLALIWKRPGLLLTLLGIGFLFSLFNGGDDDCDCDM